MRDFVDLAELISQDKIDLANRIESNIKNHVHSKIREVDAKFIVQSKRQLWQALGHEYIEPELLDYIDSMEKGSIFYDIGASNGIFSIYASLKGLQVYSFEAEVQNFGLLEMNNYLNYKNYQYPHKSFNIAASDQNCLGSMFISKHEAGGHLKILNKAQKVGEIETFTPDYVQNVIEFRLDDFIKQYELLTPHYIKIDVDGAELKVLNGLEKVWKSNILKSIFIELHENTEDTLVIQKKLKSLGFREKSKHQVQHYTGLNNYIFEKNLWNGKSKG